jgi:hypothetical protein
VASAVKIHLSGIELIFIPRYANVGPAAAQALREELLRESRLSYVHHGDSPIPPYMPLQQPVTRKSTSLEKRIKKKKEKEGCKQQ